MNINNRNKVVKLKRMFFIVSILLALTTLALFLFGKTYMALTVIGVFSLWYLFFMIADYQFIEFKSENGMIRLRYFKAISFGGTAHNEIEFPVQLLKRAAFENSFFGQNTDLTFYIRTKKGIAEYPSVSLTALHEKDREKLANLLNSVNSVN